MGYALFILLNAVLFIRPGELVPALAPLRLYQLTIIACLAANYGEIFRQLDGARAARNPQLICCLGLLSAVVLSHLQFGSIYDARMGGYEFFKLVLYFLLLLACVNSPGRLQNFLSWLVAFTLFATVLALLQFHELVDIPALAAYEQREIDPSTGELIVFPRLCGSGLFNDPNDVCLMLCFASMICLYKFSTEQRVVTRVMWLLPVVIYFAAFLETKSRGGLISLVTAMGILSCYRFGRLKTMALGAACLPVAALGLGGRLTNIDVSGGTGQHRIQLWREALALLREFPILGVGQGMMPEYTRLVAHNSYVHCFAELGFYGGSFFVGLVVSSILQLSGMTLKMSEDADPKLIKLRPFMLAIVCGYCAGLITLSRIYIVPTYLIFGLTAVYIGLSERRFARPFFWQVRPELAFKLAGASLAVLAVLEVGSRLLVRWEG